MSPTSMTNDRLCALAQKGDTHAADLLLEQNSGFIRKTANEIFLKSNLAESDLSIEPDDLEQEGSIGLWKAISTYDQRAGVKFLTYAAPLIRNAMTDLVRDAFSRYEQRMVDCENGLGFKKSGWMKSSPAKSDCCAWRRLPTSPPNLRNRLMRKEKPCGSCTRAWDKSPSGSRPIFCTVMDLRTILGTRRSAQRFIFISARKGQRSWRARRWTTSGWSCRGGFSAQRCGGTGALYTSASFSGQSDFASRKSCVCAVAHITKSACPPAAKKRLSPHSAAPQSTPPTPFPRQPEAKV